MALTEQQNIPLKPVAKEPWTFRRLFPFGNTATSSLIKTFVNPLDVLLAYLVFILGVAELLGRDTSWMFWLFTVLILFANLYKRDDKEKNSELEKKQEVNEDNK